MTARIMIIVISGLLAVAPSIAWAFPTFTDQTSAAGISVGSAGQGVAWGDYDNDGDEDAIVGVNANPPLLYKNNGNGTFTDVSGATFSGVQSGNCVVWADVDNDGDLDLFIGAYLQSGQNYLFRNDGSDSFTDVSSSSGITASDESFTATFADYDGDGDLDLYAGGYSANNVLLVNDGSGVFAALSPFAGETAGDARGSVWFDYDGDADLDLYLSNENAGVNMMLRNDAGSLTDATGGAPLDNTGGNGRAACIADLDNDGDFDMYIANFLATNKLLRNDAGSFTELSPHTLAISPATVGITMADFSHNGNVDVLLHNSGAADAMFENNGGLSFTDVTAAPLNDSGTARGCAAADYDNDGDVDIIIGNNSDGAKLFRNDQNDNKWLKVKVVGSGGKNLFGIGSIVRVYVAGTSTLVGMRQIGANVSYASMDSLIAHFGLPSASQKYDVKVTFPSGTLTESTNLDAGQTVTVEEGGAAATPTPPGAAVDSAQWCLYE